MDPISQGALGATAAQAFGPRSLGRHNAWIGWLAGMAADLDVLIRSSSDPLLGLEYHRHFTHSFAFAPLGALLVALPCWGILRGLQQRAARTAPAGGATAPAGFGAVLACALIAYLTHAPLDACTSYGTLLLWPFSDHRYAWDWLPVVEPVATGALLLGFVGSLRSGRRRGASIALMFFVLYTGLAALLHERAEAGLRLLAATRGDRPTAVRAMPKLPTIFVWRGVYATTSSVRVDTLRVIPGLPTAYIPGGRRPRYSIPASAPASLAADIRRFQWFAQGLTTAFQPERDNLGELDRPSAVQGVIDLRYGPQDRAEPLWGITWDAPRPESSLRYERVPTSRLTSELDWIVNVLLGRDGKLRPLPSGN